MSAVFYIAHIGQTNPSQLITQILSKSLSLTNSVIVNDEFVLPDAIDLWEHCQNHCSRKEIYQNLAIDR